MCDYPNGLLTAKLICLQCVFAIEFARCERTRLLSRIFDVFLCHSREDKPAVREIALQLVMEGIKLMAATRGPASLLPRCIQFLRPRATGREGTIPDRLRPYLLGMDQSGNATSPSAERYQFWVYRQIRKRLNWAKCNLKTVSLFQ
jgi:hypothetical protein